MQKIRFPAYRDHEFARVEANDAMVTLLISSRLGLHVLDLMKGSLAYLPDVFPEVNEIRRLNRSISDAQLLMTSSERHLAMMAIPFALSIHQDYVSKCIGMLLDGEEPDEAQTSLEQIHAYLISLTARELDSDELALFHIARRLRNRILHASGIAGSHERTEYLQTLSNSARNLWEKRAGRALELVSGKPLPLGAGELYAVLGVTKSLADAVNDVVVQALPRATWAKIASDDYMNVIRSTRPSWQHLRSFRGYCARQYYRNLDLTDAETEAAWNQVLANQKEGSAC